MEEDACEDASFIKKVAKVEIAPLVPEPLVISYRDPLNGAPRQEEVFVDRNAPIAVGRGSVGPRLLVSVESVTTLKQSRLSAEQKLQMVREGLTTSRRLFFNELQQLRGLLATLTAAAAAPPETAEKTGDKDESSTSAKDGARTDSANQSQSEEDHFPVYFFHADQYLDDKVQELLKNANRQARLDLKKEIECLKEQIMALGGSGYRQILVLLLQSGASATKITSDLVPLMCRGNDERITMENALTGGMRTKYDDLIKLMAKYEQDLVNLTQRYGELERLKAEQIQEMDKLRGRVKAAKEANAKEKEENETLVKTQEDLVVSIETKKKELEARVAAEKARLEAAKKELEDSHRVALATAQADDEASTRALEEAETELKTEQDIPAATCLDEVRLLQKSLELTKQRMGAAVAMKSEVEAQLADIQGQKAEYQAKVDALTAELPALQAELESAGEIPESVLELERLNKELERMQLEQNELEKEFKATEKETAGVRGSIQALCKKHGIEYNEDDDDDDEDESGKAKVKVELPPVEESSSDDDDSEEDLANMKYRKRLIYAMTGETAGTKHFFRDRKAEEYKDPNAAEKRKKKDKKMDYSAFLYADAESRRRRASKKLGAISNAREETMLATMRRHSQVGVDDDPFKEALGKRELVAASDGCPSRDLEGGLSDDDREVQVVNGMEVVVVPHLLARLPDGVVARGSSPRVALEKELSDRTALLEKRLLASERRLRASQQRLDEKAWMTARLQDLLKALDGQLRTLQREEREHREQLAQGVRGLLGSLPGTGGLGEVRGQIEEMLGRYEALSAEVRELEDAMAKRVTSEGFNEAADLYSQLFERNKKLQELATSLRQLMSKTVHQSQRVRLIGVAMAHVVGTDETHLKFLEVQGRRMELQERMQQLSDTLERAREAEAEMQRAVQAEEEKQRETGMELSQISTMCTLSRESGVLGPEDQSLSHGSSPPPEVEPLPPLMGRSHGASGDVALEPPNGPVPRTAGVSPRRRRRTAPTLKPAAPAAVGSKSGSLSTDFGFRPQGEGEESLENWALFKVTKSEHSRDSLSGADGGPRRRITPYATDSREMRVSASEPKLRSGGDNFAEYMSRTLSRQKSVCSRRSQIPSGSKQHRHSLPYIAGVAQTAVAGVAPLLPASYAAPAG